MKVQGTAVLLCSLLAAATALPHQLNSVTGTSQFENSVQGAQHQHAHQEFDNNIQDDTSFDAAFGQENLISPVEDYTYTQPQPNVDHIQEQPLSGPSPFGALIAKAEASPSSDVQVASQYSFGESSAPEAPEAPVETAPALVATVIEPLDTYQLPEPYNAPVPEILPSGPFNLPIGGDSDFYMRTAFPVANYQPSPYSYTSLDLAQVDFANLRDSGHQEYITVPDDDLSGEDEVYRLVGVAPATAVRGGSAITYSANIGDTVPVYSELDDIYEDMAMMQYVASRPQPTQYSGQGSPQPWEVPAKATLDGINFVLLLDD